MPSCYGKYWEGRIDGPCMVGKGCKLFDECLAHFARITLMRTQEQNGPSVNPADLAIKVGVSTESVLMAVNFQRNNGIAPNYLKIQEHVDSNAHLSMTEPSKNEEKTVRHRKTTEIKPGNSQKLAHRTKTMDSKHDSERFIRERRRTPLIAKLTPGMVLTSKHKGVRIETLVRIDHYLVIGVKYPTLYAAMVSIIGTKSYPKQLRPDGTRPPGTREMTAISAVRYYKLKKLLGDR